MSAFQYASPNSNLPVRNRENSWVDRMMNPRADAAAFQDLKFTLHRKLLDRVNLEAVLALPEDRVRSEIRGRAVPAWSRKRRRRSASTEKERLIDEVLDEVFGLGPLEPLAAGSRRFPTFW